MNITGLPDWKQRNADMLEEQVKDLSILVEKAITGATELPIQVNLPVGAIERAVDKLANRYLRAGWVVTLEAKERQTGSNPRDVETVRFIQLTLCSTGTRREIWYTGCVKED